ncbi:hypothetical protein LTR64_000774 [Lithohypha guttulata]|uniref:uncharacterized protein n=1 Tax=Lithohypha guttulata TaxID=1690604 RepID=UPI002DDF38C0|nr:hypothetical protein LTR51_005459 [Lithohypha guttulata]
MPKQERLNNDAFLEALGSLLTTTTSSSYGSVFLAQKPMPSSDSSTPSSQVLIRATNGTATSSASSKSKVAKQHKPRAKVKLATVVDHSDLENFYAKYAEVCKKGMEGLRKRDKKKAKGKAKAAKKKKGNVAG